MLPDFPKVKAKLFHVYMQRLERNTFMSSPPFNEIPRTIVHEGNRTVLVREDGAEEESPLAKMETKFDLSLEDVASGSIDDIIKKIDKAANELAVQQAQHFMAEFHKSVEKVGNVVDATGEKPNPDLLYAMMEKVQIDFNDQGEIAEGFCFVAGEKTAKQLATLQEVIESDPAEKERFDELLRRKREEWRDRESNRKLVG